VPTDKVILERAQSLCNEACYTVALQCRRLRSQEPEDNAFIFRWWADLQFLIIALRRLRRAAELGENISSVSTVLKEAIRDFDHALPNIKKIRNVGEHIDQYVLDAPKRHHKDVHRGELQVGHWDGTVFTWLGTDLNIDAALDAAEKLFLTVQQLRI
jgi:hypothetical protein